MSPAIGIDKVTDLSSTFDVEVNLIPNQKLSDNPPKPKNLVETTLSKELIKTMDNSFLVDAHMKKSCGSN